MITILSFIFVLGVLVFIHELGHFLVARKVGIKVEKFSLGFPPNIFEKKIGETTYCLGIIPLGGYVKMIGENPDDDSTGAPNEFMSKTVGQRAAVIFAGPFMNYILAIFLFFAITLIWGKPVRSDSPIIIGAIGENMPALNAGLEVGDQIIAVDGTPINSFDSLRNIIGSKVEEKIEITWLRGEETFTAELTTLSVEEVKEDGTIETVGRIGFSPKPNIVFDEFGFVESLQFGFTETNDMIVRTIYFLKGLITAEVSSKNLGGPVFIAKLSGDMARRGAFYLFSLMAILSVNLAVLNVLPIPVLDGGHLVFLAIEKIKGSPLSIKARGIAQQAGMLLLFSLIIFVTYNDIVRLFTGI